MTWDTCKRCGGRGCDGCGGIGKDYDYDKFKSGWSRMPWSGWEMKTKVAALFTACALGGAAAFSFFTNDGEPTSPPTAEASASVMYAQKCTDFGDLKNKSKFEFLQKYSALYKYHTIDTDTADEIIYSCTPPGEDKKHIKAEFVTGRHGRILSEGKEYFRDDIMPLGVNAGPLFDYIKGERVEPVTHEFKPPLTSNLRERRLYMKMFGVSPFEDETPPSTKPPEP